MVTSSKKSVRKAKSIRTISKPSTTAPKLLNDNSESHFSVYVQNVRGLGSKHKRFYCTSSAYDYDIVILTETWLKNSHHDAEYFDDSFSVYRKDRLNRRGGGVLIALKNSIFSSEQIDIDGADNIEYVCIRAKIKAQTVYIYNA